MFFLISGQPTRFKTPGADMFSAREFQKNKTVDPYSADQEASALRWSPRFYRASNPEDAVKFRAVLISLKSPLLACSSSDTSMDGWRPADARIRRQVGNDPAWSVGGVCVK